MLTLHAARAIYTIRAPCLRPQPPPLLHGRRRRQAEAAPGAPVGKHRDKDRAGGDTGGSVARRPLPAWRYTLRRSSSRQSGRAATPGRETRKRTVRERGGQYVEILVVAAQ